MELERMGDSLVVRLDDEFRGDLPLVSDLKTQLAGPPRIVVAMRSVRYVSSSGLGSLARFFQEVRECGGAMCIAGASEGVRDLLYLADLDLLFDFADGEQEAVQRLMAAASEAGDP